MNLNKGVGISNVCGRQGCYGGEGGKGIGWVICDTLFIGVEVSPVGNAVSIVLNW